MAESTTRFDRGHDEEIAPTSVAPITPQPQIAVLPERYTPVPAELVIWTPLFIVLFFLTLVVGLSAGSVLTQGWLNGYYKFELILFIYNLLNLASWVAVILFARSKWIRAGAIFGVIWAAFSALTYLLAVYSVSRDPAFWMHLKAATNSALFGSYVCLSIGRIPLQRWDSRFFTLAPLVAIAIGMLWLFLFPPRFALFTAIEYIMSIVALYLCIGTWWLRPSCWKKQPGPAFLFGFAPALQLLLLLPAANGKTIFFFLQVAFLCYILGAIRLLQRELRSRGRGRNITPPLP